MNPSELASLLSTVGSGGGAAGLMQGSHRGRVLPGRSTQPGTSVLDAFSQHTPDSRPNTAPAGTRSSATTTTTGGTTSAASSRPSGSSTSKPRNAGTSSASSTAAPKSGSSTGATSGPKGGPIQMSALSSILANLSDKTAGPETAGASSGAAKPAIDLYDIMNTEVKSIVEK